MSTTSSIAKPEFGEGDAIAGFQVIKKLGSGGFGAVYQVEKDEKQYALKTEYVLEENDDTLRNEVHMLRIMQGSKSFCELISAKKIKFKELDINIMVMTLCSRSISRLRRQMPERKFTKATASRLSFQILQALKDLHGMGILHRDVKASNCGWHEEKRRVLLFDLGFSRKFLELDENTDKMRVRPARMRPGFKGTSKYCSLNAHEEMDQGRRDDLWAWLYTTVEFFTGSLPWSDDPTNIILVRKQRIGRKMIMKCPREILVIFEYISKLNYESCPNYNLLFNQLDLLFRRIGVEKLEPYDFEKTSEFYKKYFFEPLVSSDESSANSEVSQSENENDEEKKQETWTAGSASKANRVVDVDAAPALENGSEEEITLNSTRSTLSSTSRRHPAGLDKSNWIDEVVDKLKTFF